MKKICLLILGVLLLNACTESGGAKGSKTYVQVFVLPDSFELVDHGNGDVLVWFEGDYIRSRDSRFVELCEKYGDYEYNRYIYAPELHVVIAEDFLSADVVCEQDFNETHPAGSSLGDIVKLKASSPYEYIQARYPKNGPQYTKTDQYLNQLTKSDMILLDYGSYIFIHFTETPAPGEYTFTVTFRSEEKTLSSQMTLTF